MFNLEIVQIDYEYTAYLRKFDSRVSYNSNNKKRPFIGVLFTIKNIKYFAPLSSPKAKHLKMKNTIDFLKLKEGRLGAINFNNMIPVTNKNYKKIDLTDSTDKYIKLLKEQLSWLNKNKIQIKSRAQKIYYLYKNNKLPLNIKKRCCNYLLLEEKCKEYSHDFIKI